MSNGFRPRSFRRGRGSFRLPAYILSGVCLQDHQAMLSYLPEDVLPPGLDESALQLEAPALILHLREIHGQCDDDADSVCIAIPEDAVSTVIEMLRRWQLSHSQHLHAYYEGSDPEFTVSVRDLPD